MLNAASRTIGGPIPVDHCLKVSSVGKTADFRHIDARRLKNMTSGGVEIDPENVKSVMNFSFNNVSRT